MSTMEATLLATIQAAGSGNSHAGWIALDAMRQAEQRIAAEAEAVRADFAAFRLRQLRRIAAAEAAGEDSALILPHPDDIDPWHPTGPRITGPADDREWQEVLVTVRLREAWILQAALDRSLDRAAEGAARRTGPCAPEKGRTEEDGTGTGTGTRNARGVAARNRPAAAVDPGDAWKMATFADMCLPLRLRRDFEGLVARHMEVDRLDRRTLLKETRAAWAAAGMEMPRGMRSPPSGWLRPVLTAGARAVREVLAPGFDPRDVEAVAADLLDEMTAIVRARSSRQSPAAPPSPAPASPFAGRPGGHPAASPAPQRRTRFKPGDPHDA